MYKRIVISLYVYKTKNFYVFTHNKKNINGTNKNIEINSLQKPTKDIETRLRLYSEIEFGL